MECDGKARAAQNDIIPETTCKFLDIRHFIARASLDEMDSVKVSAAGKRFKKWTAIAKGAGVCKDAFCSQHMKQRLFYTSKTVALSSKRCLFLSGYVDKLNNVHIYIYIHISLLAHTAVQVSYQTSISRPERVYVHSLVNNG